VLVVAATHPWAALKKPTATDLKDGKWVVR
jgi:hypothetical protein